MTASGKEQALERYKIIQPFLEEGVPLAEIARHHKIALRTARRWVSRYRAGGLSALGRPSRSDKGSRWALSEPLQELVEALALETPRRSVAAIHLNRLVAQIRRIMQLNGLQTITREVVETARECLVIGTS